MAAFATDPSIILVNSFNDWPGGSATEKPEFPLTDHVWCGATPDADYSLERTREWAAQFRTKKEAVTKRIRYVTVSLNSLNCVLLLPRPIIPDLNISLCADSIAIVCESSGRPSLVIRALGANSDRATYILTHHQLRLVSMAN
jgi:hypothetical protein